jgi:hypothetical protein
LPLTHCAPPWQYSSEDPENPWNDQCYPDPKKEFMTNPPDTRPYCKSMAKLVRLKVDADLTKATPEQELFRDWCTSTYTHHVGKQQNHTARVDGTGPLAG